MEAAQLWDTVPMTTNKRTVGNTPAYALAVSTAEEGPRRCIWEAAFSGSLSKKD
jgi:hypothetical protein